jgi:hypothetical protein
MSSLMSGRRMVRPLLAASSYSSRYSVWNTRFSVVFDCF